MDNTTPKGRWLRLVVGIVSLLFAGVIYAWSILKAPLAAEFGWTPQQLALNFTVTMCFFCVGGMLSGTLLKRFPPRAVVLIAAGLTFAGFFWTSRNNGSLVALYLGYGVLAGSGIGMAYNAILASTNAWFPDKQGVSSGCLMMGFGASSLVLGSLADGMFRSPSLGWRAAFLIVGAAIGAVLLLAGLCVAFPPAGTALPAPTPKKQSAICEDFEPCDYTAAQMLRRSSFWRFFLFSITLASIGSVVISMAKDLALTTGASTALATTLVGVLSVCNGLGRLVSGALFDAVGRRRTMLAGNIVTILAPLILLPAVHYGSLPLCVAGLALSGLSYGFSPPISGTFISTFYGQKNFAMNFSIANTMLIPTSFAATLAGAMVTASGSYVSTFLLLIGFSAVSLLLNLSIKRP